MLSFLNYLAYFSYGLTAVAVALFAYKGREIYGLISRGQADPTRGDRKGRRFAWMTHEVLSHTKMNRFTPSGVAHWFVMIGFVTLFGSLVQAYGEAINPDFRLPVIGNWFIYKGFVVGIAGLTGIGIITLMKVRAYNMFIRKDRKNRFLGSVTWRGLYVEWTILAVVVCIFILNFAHNETLIRATASIKIIVSMLWFVVVASNLTMGVAWHRFLAPFNIFFQRNPDKRPSLGAVPEMLSHGKPINFEDPSEDDVFGIGKSADISWKGLQIGRAQV